MSTSSAYGTRNVEGSMTEAFGFFEEYSTRFFTSIAKRFDALPVNDMWIVFEIEWYVIGVLCKQNYFLI